MALITVFFPGPRKAIIDENHKDYFLELGAVETQAAAEPEKKPPELDPDKGFGRPGSLRWHTLKINELETNGAIYKYCREVTGKGFGVRNFDVDQCKEIAIERIKEHLSDDKS